MFAILGRFGLNRISKISIIPSPPTPLPTEEKRPREKLWVQIPPSGKRPKKVGLKARRGERLYVDDHDVGTPARGSVGPILKRGDPGG